MNNNLSAKSKALIAWVIFISAAVIMLSPFAWIYYNKQVQISSNYLPTSGVVIKEEIRKGTIGSSSLKTASVIQPYSIQVPRYSYSVNGIQYETTRVSLVENIKNDSILNYPIGTKVSV
jgi:hypothetical protein